MVIDNAGGGKSTMCRALTSVHALPYYAVDKIQWMPNWIPTPEPDFTNAHEALLSQERWRIDGYGSWASVMRPEIFVIHPSDMDFTERDTPINALFNELMIRPSRTIPLWMGSRMATYDHYTVSNMCYAIRFYRVPGLLGYGANRALSWLLAGLVPLSGMAEILGIPLLGFVLLKPEFLAARSEFASPLGIVSGFLGGFALRCSAFWLAEDVRQRDYSYAPGVFELLSALAFFARPQFVYLHYRYSTLFGFF
jgi:hypothetical protein